MQSFKLHHMLVPAYQRGYMDFYASLGGVFENLFNTRELVSHVPIHCYKKPSFTLHQMRHAVRTKQLVLATAIRRSSNDYARYHAEVKIELVR